MIPRPSSAELDAPRLALADIPLRQDLAVNRHGLVKAIGGINQQIEGFFGICAARGMAC
jgi:predicted ATP-dependent protease